MLAGRICGHRTSTLQMAQTRAAPIGRHQSGFTGQGCSQFEAITLMKTVFVILLTMVQVARG